jgi:hypothetical protein
MPRLQEATQDDIALQRVSVTGQTYGLGSTPRSSPARSSAHGVHAAERRRPCRPRRRVQPEPVARADTARARWPSRGARGSRVAGRFSQPGVVQTERPRRCANGVRGPTQRRYAPRFRENPQMAQLESPPPDILALRVALRGRPDDTRLFAMAAFEMIPRDTFFQPRQPGTDHGPGRGLAGRS